MLTSLAKLILAKLLPAYQYVYDIKGILLPALNRKSEIAVNQKIFNLFLHEHTKMVISLDNSSIIVLLHIYSSIHCRPSCSHEASKPTFHTNICWVENQPYLPPSIFASTETQKTQLCHFITKPSPSSNQIFSGMSLLSSS